MVRLARISHCQLAHSGASVSIFGGQGKEYGRGEYRCHVVSNAHTRWRNKAVSAVPLPGSEGGPHYTLLASVDSAKPSQYAAGEGNNKNRDGGHFPYSRLTKNLHVAGHDKPRSFNTSTLV